MMYYMRNLNENFMTNLWDDIDIFHPQQFLLIRRCFDNILNSLNDNMGGSNHRFLLEKIKPNHMGATNAKN